MKLFTRVLAVVALLVVPLGLALASQTLASRPGRPPVPAAPVVLQLVPSAPATGRPTAPGSPPATASSTTAAPATGAPGGPAPAPPRREVAPPPQREAPRQAPRVVRPAPVPLTDDTDDDDADDTDDSGEDDSDD